MSKPLEKKNLTEKQEAFLDALFGSALGNMEEAKRIAGYSPNYESGLLMRALRDEIIERCTNFLALNSPKAVMNLIGVIDDPVQPAAREKIAAIKEVLDRAGLVKTEKVQHESQDQQVIFILPAKEKDEDQELLLEANSEETPT